MSLIIPSTQPYPQRLFRQYETPYITWEYPSSSRPVTDGWEVSNSSELLEAIADAYAGIEAVTLYLQTNEYPEVANMVAGKDFTGKKLVIMGRNPASRPLIVNSPQGLSLARNVEISDIDFQLGYVTDTWHFNDGGGLLESGSVRNFTLRNSKLTGLSKDLYAAPSATYRDGMCEGIRLTCSHSYNHIIDNVEIDFVHRAIEMKMNGSVMIRDFISRHAYYDNFRIVGQGDEGYVDGNRYIINARTVDGLGAYEEINDGEPHKDGLQFFGSSGTNPKCRNLFIYRIDMSHGDKRGSRIQAFLAQIPLENCAVVEGLLLTKEAAHAGYLESGGSNVIFERSTMGDLLWQSGARGRNYRCYGEVIYKDMLCIASVDDNGAGENENLPGYSMRSVNSHFGAGFDSPAKHAALFAGPSAPAADNTKASFTPLSDTGQGALGLDGNWRGGAHLPMEAEAPDITGGSGQFTIEEIMEPTLGLHEVEGYDNDTEYTYNVRWCVADSYEWTEVSGVRGPQSVGAEPSVVTGVTAGSIWVQSQCVNDSGPGAWSQTAITTVTGA